jgi:hypothetical protein
MISDPPHRPVSALRQRMIEDMRVRGFTEKTRSDYVRNGALTRNSFTSFTKLLLFCKAFGFSILLIESKLSLAFDILKKRGSQLE